jgi:hypothetical protein
LSSCRVSRSTCRQDIGMTLVTASFRFHSFQKHGGRWRRDHFTALWTIGIQTPTSMSEKNICCLLGECGVEDCTLFCSRLLRPSDLFSPSYPAVLFFIGKMTIWKP